MKWEFPRLCRGGSQTLRIPGVYLPLLPSFCRSPLPREPRAVAVASAFQRLRSGPFEGPATVKPPALPEDTYLGIRRSLCLLSLDVPYQVHKSIQCGVTQIEESVLDVLHARLQFLFGKVMAGLAGAVHLQQRTVNLVIAD